jgi:RNA polymerase sigma-70 factor (ECF subfamily)
MAESLRSKMRNKAAPKMPKTIAIPALAGLKMGMAMRGNIPDPSPHPGTAGGLPANLTHEQLLLRVATTQDRAAFVELFKYYGPRIKSYLLKNGADSATAEEIVQNTFITVWEKAAGFNPKKAGPSTWIFTIARNKRIDILRRQKFVADIDDDSPVLANLAAETTEEYADSQTVEKLHSAIEDLPPEQADLLRLAFFEDKSHQDISDMTALPLGTVKSRLRLAMGKLRQALGKAEANGGGA